LADALFQRAYPKVSIRQPIDTDFMAIRTFSRSFFESAASGKRLHIAESRLVQNDRDLRARTVTHRPFNLLKVTLTVEMAFGCAGATVTCQRAKANILLFRNGGQTTFQRSISFWRMLIVISSDG
jgi:hypothetical protein